MYMPFKNPGNEVIVVSCDLGTLETCGMLTITQDTMDATYFNL